MDVPKLEDLTQCPDDDKELSRDSYLSPTFSIHGDIVAGCPSGSPRSSACEAGFWKSTGQCPWDVFIWS